MTYFALTHSEPVETHQRLKDLERHGLRLDRLARENLRPGAVAGAGLDWPDVGGRRLTKAYAGFKKRNDVDPRKGAQLLHSTGIGVPPGWMREAGDLHNATNSRNVQVFEAPSHGLRALPAMMQWSAPEWIWTRRVVVGSTFTLRRS